MAVCLILAPFVDHCKESQRVTSYTNSGKYQPLVKLDIPDAKSQDRQTMKSADLDFYRQLGELIKDRRKERRLTQEQLAELWKLNRTTVVNIEKGRQRISVLQLVELADYLGCSSSDLLPRRSGSRVLSENLRARVQDERAFSFASEVVAAGRKTR